MHVGFKGLAVNLDAFVLENNCDAKKDEGKAMIFFINWLTLSMLGKILSRWHFEMCIFFPRK